MQCSVRTRQCKSLLIESFLPHDISEWEGDIFNTKCTVPIQVTVVSVASTQELRNPVTANNIKAQTSLYPLDKKCDSSSSTEEKVRIFFF